MQTRRGGASIVPSHSQPGIRRRMVTTTPRTLYAPKIPDTHLQETGWASKAVWAAWKISTLLGFDPRTVQPVTTRYTDYDIPAANIYTEHWLNAWYNVLVTSRQLVSEEQNQERVKISVGSARTVRHDDPS